MRNLDNLFDTLTVAGLTPRSLVFMGPAVPNPENAHHAGILRGSEVQYYTYPIEDPEGLVTRITWGAD